MPYMYILECSDSTCYLGSTWRVRERVAEHHDGLGFAYARHRLPVRLVRSDEYPSIAEAFGREKQVQAGAAARAGA